MKAVIVAAGKSSRLWQITDKRPKTLLPFADGSILSTILDNLANAGINEFIIVLGYEANTITAYLKENDNFGHKISLIMNHDFHKGNGISVHISNRLLNNEEFILSMSDHIVSPSAIKRVILSTDERNLLLVDKNHGNVFDIDDATKVNIKDTRILGIGKSLNSYNGIDCGIFRLNERFFTEMGKQIDSGKESISAGVIKLIQKNDMAAVYMHEDEVWLDIDTPEAYRHIQDNSMKF